LSEDRCTFVARDFFESVRPGGDLYVVLMQLIDELNAGRLARICLIIAVIPFQRGALSALPA
jgi:hypothetical protein